MKNSEHKVSILRMLTDLQAVSINIDDSIVLVFLQSPKASLRATVRASAFAGCFISILTRQALVDPGREVR